MNNEVQFMRAQPVWAENRAHEMNMTILFRSRLKTACPSGTVLRLTGSSCYTVYINGCLFAMGPARCAHGFYRVDEQCLDAVLRGNDVVAIISTAMNGWICRHFCAQKSAAGIKYWLQPDTEAFPHTNIRSVYKRLRNIHFSAPLRKYMISAAERILESRFP